MNSANLIALIRFITMPFQTDIKSLKTRRPSHNMNGVHGKGLGTIKLTVKGAVRFVKHLFESISKTTTQLSLKYLPTFLSDHNEKISATRMVAEMQGEQPLNNICTTKKVAN
jgi:hypothetical protein